MPLPKRLVEPVLIARGTLPANYPLPSELEAVTNGTLANTVRQLSSLSRHAEDLFGELVRDSQNLYDRSNSLQARIDRLAIKVTQLDSTVEEVSLQDIHKRKAFRSAVVFDQQIFSRSTMPTAMLETYQSCDEPPPLDKLNCYRDDGRDGLKFYTDPNYFFELWRQEMIKDTERAMQGKKPHKPRNAQGPDGSGGQRSKKRVRQPHKTIERQRQIAMGHGEYITPQPNMVSSQQPQQQQQTAQSTPMIHYRSPIPEEMMAQAGAIIAGDRPNRPNSIEIRRSYQQQQQQEVPDGIHSPPYPPYEENPYQQGMYGQGPLSSESLYQPGTPTRKIRPTQPPPAPPSNQSTPSANTPTRSRSMSTGRDNLPPPPPPPETTSMSPPNGLPPHLVRGSRSNSPHSNQGTPEPPMMQDLPPPPPVPKQESPPRLAQGTRNAQGQHLSQGQHLQGQHLQGQHLQGQHLSQGHLAQGSRLGSQQAQAPPPPPPPPMPLMMSVNGPMSPPPMTNGGSDQLAKLLTSAPPKLTPPKERAVQKALPMVDPRNDLLKAIRDGIKLRKVEKIEQKEVERGNGLHDVASILARRVAVEFSDSDSASESECDSEGWGENETSA